jgi:hypothetical protein
MSFRDMQYECSKYKQRNPVVCNLAENVLVYDYMCLYVNLVD